MARMMFQIGRGVKSTLRKIRRATKDKGLALRCQIVLGAGKGRGPTAIAEGVGCSRSTVWRVLKRFQAEGIRGLHDRREDNGALKLDGTFLGLLYQLVEGTPWDYGYRRSTWTRELLIRVMEQKLSVKIHLGTMSRALAQIGARRGRPKPTVHCPWKKSAKQQRLNQLQALVSKLSPQEVLFYEDEVDIHLNPKIGLDWMNRGQQKQVLTPGKNEKSYLAGAMDSRTGKLVWVGGGKKNSGLFIQLIQELLRTHKKAKTIHLILDNYRIHKSRQVAAFLAPLKGRIRLHFLPPYCPDANRIERLWKDLHDNVTRNHQCDSMIELGQEVSQYLNDRNQYGPQPLSRIAA
jgi:transposase